MVFAILSSCNEANNPKFWHNLQLLKQTHTAFCVVDGGSVDGTLERLSGEGVKPLSVLPGSTRAERFNFGLQHSSEHWTLLVHPRSQLSAEGLRELGALPLESGWGAFRHCFDHNHPLLRFTSWYSNNVRGARCGIFYLDHCLFVSRDLREIRIPDIPVFEDTEYSRLLRGQKWPRLLQSSVVTSAVRFERNGIYRQALMNQILKIMYWLRVPPVWMNRIYEKGLGLNQSGKN